MAYTIGAALESGIFDVVYVSTDSEEYAAIARAEGAEVPFLRSVRAASDEASTWTAVLEAIENYSHMGMSFDTVAILQPTSPLRRASDIVEAYSIMLNKDAQSVVSVCECEHPPAWCNALDADMDMKGFIKKENDRRRQECGRYYRFNGAIYITKVSALKTHGEIDYDDRCFAYEMPAGRSVDIDTAYDFVVAEALMDYFG